MYLYFQKSSNYVFFKQCPWYSITKSEYLVTQFTSVKLSWLSCSRESLYGISDKNYPRQNTFDKQIAGIIMIKPKRIKTLLKKEKHVCLLATHYLAYHSLKKFSRLRYVNLVTRLEKCPLVLVIKNRCFGVFEWGFLVHFFLTQKAETLLFET